MAFSRPSLMARGVRRPRLFSNRRSSLYALALTVLLMLSVVLLMLLALGIFSLPVPSNSAPEGVDIRQRHDRSVFEATTTYLGDGNGLGKRGVQWTEVVSWEPRAFIYHNFLSKEECEYLIKLAKPHMVKSTVVDSTTGRSKGSRVRTSSGMFLRRGQDKIIQYIEKRIADYTFIPVEHGEGLQVLHYGVGQKYEPHFDYFLDEFNTKNGGQRMATLLMYLSDVEEGGETIFPSVKVNSSSLPSYNELSECGKKGLSVKPKMGDALLFWSMKPDAIVDPLSLHGACPVIKGNKWSCTKWMHIHEYEV
ncbi:probable prolyl 4-hydroxylase 3 [Phoenix dactylifera]|uniref:procollagen-proline 4-dioxygenase n=1 Tax=Phoenix dactylifera TaxID=42345 RepID=A0A8B7MWM2_PHODC|nr:probable prolyl 4-hydroxylase 3 [Phoenix dactylifera]XP_008802377.1 probable prolyl 4-hydroxylase 3 [Phoenix dactylifera]XP_017701212.1 probable prolyl 4-hydroxylase 3 [Phoenix dactylifera]XP_038971067.1 probable prolyl 4-hydroxylase 3 [Phoenix dactylifera]